MAAGLHHLVRCIVVLASLCLLGGAANAQQSGTLLQRTTTASGASTLTMEFDVVGLIGAGTQTELTLEIGPEGNGITSAVPIALLPATVVFTVSTSASAGSLTFSPAGGTYQKFAGKVISLIRLDPSSSPALYRLVVVHPAEVPEGTKETWKLVISGLPQTRTRVIGAIKQGIFSSLLPIGACQTLPGQSGTALRRMVTFRGAVNPAIGIDIAGPRDALTQTTLMLEFGPDGNARTSPVPDPALPDAARMRISTSVSSDSISFPIARSDATFANKELHLIPLAPRDSPGLYLLVIQHKAEVPDGTTERWMVELTGIPTTTLRAISVVEQGTIASLTPVAVCQDPPRISVSPASITGGETAEVVVTTTADDFDLSKVSESQLRFDPPKIVAKAVITNRSPKSLTLSVVTAELAQEQKATLAVTANNVTSQPATFAVVPRPSISIKQPFVIADGQATLDIMTSSSVFDLSKGQIEITPPDIATGIIVTSASQRALTATVTLAAVDKPQNLTLTVTANNVRSRPATFEVRPRPRISTKQPFVLDGPNRRLTVITSSTDLDLSKGVTVNISPPFLVTNFNATSKSPQELELSFDLTDLEQPVSATLTVAANNVTSYPVNLEFRPRPRIVIAPSSMRAGTSVRMRVTSVGGFDLRNLSPKNLTFSGPGVYAVAVVPKSTETSAIVTFRLYVNAEPGSHTLTIAMNGRRLSARYAVQRPTVVCGPGLAC